LEISEKTFWLGVWPARLAAVANVVLLRRDAEGIVPYKTRESERDIRGWWFPQEGIGCLNATEFVGAVGVAWATETKIVGNSQDRSLQL